MVSTDLQEEGAPAPSRAAVTEHDLAFEHGGDCDGTFRVVCDYMRGARINVNVRQVVSDTHNFSTPRPGLQPYSAAALAHAVEGVRLAGEASAK